MAVISSDTTLRTSYRWPGEVRVTVEYDSAANTRRGRLEIACTAVEDEAFQIAAVTDGDDVLGWARGSYLVGSAAKAEATPYVFLQPDFSPFAKP